MIKIIVFIIIILPGIVFFIGCSRQSSSLYDEVGGKIIEYLPITLSDQFELTSGMLYYHYPYGKSDFTEDERMLIYRTISGFRLYGTSHPWSNEGYIGILPYMIAKNENYVTTISFIAHPEWGYLAAAQVDDGFTVWFEMDSDTYHELVGLIGWGR